MFDISHEHKPNQTVKEFTVRLINPTKNKKTNLVTSNQYNSPYIQLRILNISNIYYNCLNYTSLLHCASIATLHVAIS